MKNGITTTKAEVLDDATRGHGCLGRARDDEPVFIIRARDEQFVDVVAGWISGARARGVNREKITSAQAVLDHGREWARDNGTKRAD